MHAMSVRNLFRVWVTAYWSADNYCTRSGRVNECIECRLAPGRVEPGRLHGRTSQACIRILTAGTPPAVSSPDVDSVKIIQQAF